MYWFILMEGNLIGNIVIKSPTKNEELFKYDESDCVKNIVFGRNREKPTTGRNRFSGGYFFSGS